MDRVDKKDDHILVYLSEVRNKPLALTICTLPNVTLGSTPALRQSDVLLLVLYQVPKGLPVSYHLTIRQDLPVNNLKPAVVTVYDYYQTSKTPLKTRVTCKYLWKIVLFAAT